VVCAALSMLPSLVDSSVCAAEGLEVVVELCEVSSIGGGVGRLGDVMELRIDVGIVGTSIAFEGSLTVGMGGDATISGRPFGCSRRRSLPCGGRASTKLIERKKVIKMPEIPMAFIMDREKDGGFDGMDQLGGWYGFVAPSSVDVCPGQIGQAVFEEPERPYR
jgi:hypothetical protein